MDERMYQMASLRGTITIPQIIRTNDIGKTVILVDDYGNEVTAVLSDEPVTLDATPNDIRVGKTAATVEGVTLGEKEIPPYYVDEGFRVITSGKDVVIPSYYNGYTNMQALICKFNSTISDSVATEKVSIGDKVYEVRSADIIASVSINYDEQQIHLGIVNNDSVPCIVRFFMYKEMY